MLRANQEVTGAGAASSEVTSEVSFTVPDPSYTMVNGFIFDGAECDMVSLNIAFASNYCGYIKGDEEGAIQRAYNYNFISGGKVIEKIIPGFSRGIYAYTKLKIYRPFITPIFSF